MFILPINKKNDQLMKKYYHMTIEVGNTNSMYNLTQWFSNTKYTNFMIDGHKINKFNEKIFLNGY